METEVTLSYKDGGQSILAIFIETCSTVCAYYLCISESDLTLLVNNDH